ESDDRSQQRDRIGVRGRDVEHALGRDAERAEDDRRQRDEHEPESSVHGPSAGSGLGFERHRQPRADAGDWEAQRRRLSRANAPPPASTSATEATRMSRMYS